MLAAGDENETSRGAAANIGTRTAVNHKMFRAISPPGRRFRVRNGRTLCLLEAYDWLSKTYDPGWALLRIRLARFDDTDSVIAEQVVGTWKLDLGHMTRGAIFLCDRAYDNSARGV